MTIRQDVAAGSGVLLIVAGFIGFFAWKQAHDSLLKAQGATEQRQESDKQIAVMKLETKVQLDSVTATVNDLRSQLAKTPAVTAPVVIREQIPSLAAVQPTIVTVPAQPASAGSPAIPAQQFAELPLASLQAAEKDIASRLLDCQQHESQLVACQADKKADIESMQALEKERDAWKLAAGHGGGFWVRLKRNGKWVGVVAAAGGITYALGKASK